MSVENRPSQHPCQQSMGVLDGLVGSAPRQHAHLSPDCFTLDADRRQGAEFGRTLAVLNALIADPRAGPDPGQAVEVATGPLIESQGFHLVVRV